MENREKDKQENPGAAKSASGSSGVKSVVITFGQPVGGATVTYVTGENEPIGSKVFSRVPKRLQFFQEKFPTSEADVAAKTIEDPVSPVTTPTAHGSEA